MGVCIGRRDNRVELAMYFVKNIPAPCLVKSVQPVKRSTQVFVNIHTHAGLTMLRLAMSGQHHPIQNPSRKGSVMLPAEDMYLLSTLGGLEALRFGTTCMDNYIYSHENARAFDKLRMRAVVDERIRGADLFKIPEGKFELLRAEIGDRLLEKEYSVIENWHNKGDGLNPVPP